jgi:hypothetical protein
MKALIIIFFPFICMSQQLNLLKSLDTSSNFLNMGVSARLNGYKTKFDNGEPFFTNKVSTVIVDEVGDFFYYATYTKSEYLELKKELDQNFKLVESYFDTETNDTELIYDESPNYTWHLMIINDEGEQLIALALESK